MASYSGAYRYAAGSRALVLAALAALAVLAAGTLPPSKAFEKNPVRQTQAADTPAQLKSQAEPGDSTATEAWL
jgi:hypothetical protein